MKTVCLKINITALNAAESSRHSSCNTTGFPPKEHPGQLLDLGGEGEIPNAGASALHATTSNQNTSTQNSNSNSKSNSNPSRTLAFADDFSPIR